MHVLAFAHQPKPLPARTDEAAGGDARAQCDGEEGAEEGAREDAGEGRGWMRDVEAVELEDEDQERAGGLGFRV